MSVLSRVWRCVWKHVHVPVLNLHRDSFPEYQNFQTYVSKVLSLRYKQKVLKLSYIGPGGRRRDVSLCAEVIKYALSHDTRHLVIDLEDGTDPEDGYKFSNLFGSVALDSNLETLRLRWIILDSGLRSSGFRILTTLCLKVCTLDFSQDEDIDLCSKFACLKNLVLDCCTLENKRNSAGDIRSVKISGPQLLSLKLHTALFPKIEISAPKLECFTLWHVLAIDEFSKLSLPSLVHADIVFSDDDYIRFNAEWTTQHIMSLFRGLSNVTSLELDLTTIQELSDIFEVLEKQPSPFTRLESLTAEADSSIPCKVFDYLFKESSCTDPKIKLWR